MGGGGGGGGVGGFQKKKICIKNNSHEDCNRINKMPKKGRSYNFLF